MKQWCNQELEAVGINPASSIEYSVNGEVEVLTLEQIIEAFSYTQTSSQMFISLFKRSLKGDRYGVTKFFEAMGEIVIRSSQGDIG